MKENIVADARLRKMAEDGGGKKWLIRGAATLAMIGGIAAAPQTETVTNHVDRFFESVLHMATTSAEAAEVSKTINDITDANVDLPRATGANSSSGTTNFTGFGTQGSSAQAGRVVQKGTTSWWTMTTGSDQSGKLVYNTALDTGEDFTVTGNIYAEGDFWQGDFVGIFVAPQLPSTLGNNGAPGSGLGIYGYGNLGGIKNATALGWDMNKAGDSYFGDPNGTYPAMVLRQTNASAGVVTLNTNYASAWQPGKGTVTSDATTQGKGTPYTLTYDADAGDSGRGILTLTMAGKSVFVQIDKSTMPYLSVGVNTTGGTGSWTKWEATMDVKGSREPIPVNVTYKDESGADLLAATKVTVGDGQSIGITGLSPAVTGESVTYNAPTIPGYYATKANTVSAKVNDANSYNYTLGVVYAKSYQAATVTKAGLNANNTVKNGTATAATGKTGDAITITDDSLKVAGYTYKVTGPNGKTYDTMQAALVDNGKFDATANGSTTTDSAMQNFKVDYTADKQTATFTYSGGPTDSRNVQQIVGQTDASLTTGTSTPTGGYIYAPMGYRIDTAASQLASGVQLNLSTGNLTASVYGTFDANTSVDQTSQIVFAPITQTAKLTQNINGTVTDVETKNGGATSEIGFTATDQSLAKNGYTYTVTGPDKQTYPTLAAALAATPNYDTTPNSTDQTDGTPQLFSVVYTDTQAPTITTGKDTFNVTTGAGVTAADFLAGVNAQTSDNQMAGDVKVTSNYDSVVKDEPGTYTVTITATDASGLQTTKQVTVVVTETSPYDQESAVASAAAALESTSRDATKTTAGTAQANEPGVQAAIANLTALQNQAATDDAGALTQDILDAITALQDAVTDAAGDQQEARLAADNALAQTKPVSHESATQDAMTKLQTLLADDSATTADIQAATKALSQAVSDDTKVRTAANTAAASEIASAQNSTAANDATVRDAVQALQDAVKTAASDSPDAVTQDILDRISDLKAAVTAAEQAQETKRSEATAILADDSETQPVTYEQATADAKVALQQVIDNPLATAADLQTAIDQYRDTATATRAVRDDAMTAGADAVTSAQNSDQSGDDRVVTAIQNLQQVMATAASDSPDALTADIEAAISAVKQAQVDAAKSRAEAADLATAALQQTGPVTNEADVATARTNLQTLIDDPTSTEQDLKNAMTELATAVTAAKTDRTTTNNEANKAITTATNGDQSAAPAVQTALQNLKDVMATAASDSPDALTADIATATAALQQAVADEDAAQETARATAATALSETAPVSNETAVASEINALQNVLQDPKATAAEITAAVTDLQSAVQTDTGTRNTANDDAATAIADAENSSLQNEPQIENAIANLNAIRKRAAADSSASLTADIIAATDALRQAMTDVAQYQADARADAAEAQQPTTTDGTTIHPEIADSKAVSEDTQTALTDAVKALNDALKNPDTPYADIKTATDDVFEAGGKALTEAATPYSDNATVESALATMQTTLADPDATAAEKHAAMDSLRATFADAAAALTDAKTVAEDALSKTAPVSNETAVKATADKLQSLLANPTATKTAIEDATKALNQAVAYANTARDAANQAADKLADQAQQSAGSGDPAVVAALAKLQKVQAAAAADSPDALTQDIAAATQALQQALDAVNSARDAANDAIAQAKPVSYESAVAAAIKHLQQALADPATPTADLAKAVNAVKTATQAAKADRDAANQAADAMRQAATKTGQNDPAVQAAVTKLANLQQLAAADNQDALTADIKAATDALKVAMQAVDDVRTAADTLLGQTKPVSHEGAVADASKQLRVLLAGNAAEGDIKSAMQALQTALDKAKPARQQAQSQATDLLTQVQNSPVRNEPAVQEMMQRLQAVMAAADQDDPKALTQDILNAMQDLQTAFNNAQAARDTANQDATALKNSVPADMADTIKDAWNHLADVQAKASRGEATTADVVAATKALADAIGQNNGIVSGPQARQAQQNAELATLGATYQPTMTTLPAAVQAGYTAIPSGYLPYTGAGVLPYTATGRTLAAGTANRVLPDTGQDTMSYLTAIGVFLFASNLFMLFAARRKREVEEN